MALGKCITPFHAMAKLKDIAKPKNLISQMSIRKGAQNRPPTTYRISLIVKITTIWAQPSFLTMFRSFPIASKSTTDNL